MTRRALSCAAILLALCLSRADAPAGEAGPLQVVIEAVVDGKPMADAGVRVVALAADGLRPGRSDAAAWLAAYREVRADGLAPLAWTDADGRASIGMPATGRCLVAVGDSELAQVRVVETWRYVAGDTIGFSLLSAPARVRTSEAWTADGPQLTVLGRQRDALQAPVWCVAGPDGEDVHTLRFDGLPPGTVQARWLDPRRGPGLWVGAAVPGATRLESEALLTQPRDVRVRGPIRAADGARLPEATIVRLGRSGPWSRPFPVEADGSFRWRLRTAEELDGYLGELTYPWAYVEAPGFVPSPRISLHPSGRQELVTAGPVVLERGILVEGSAPDLVGAPHLERWLVVQEVTEPPPGMASGVDADALGADQAAGKPPPLRWVLADADGTFRTWLLPGAWRLIAPHFRTYPSHRRLQPSDEPPDGPSTDVRITDVPVRDVVLPALAAQTLDPAAKERVIEGQVVDEAGDAIAHALVQSVDGDRIHATRTDAQGRFRLPVGPVNNPGAELRVTGAAHHRSWARLADLGDEVLIRLRPGGSAVLQATSSEGAAPVELRVRPVNAPSRARRHADEPALYGPDPDDLASFDDLGRAYLRGLRPGRHVVLVTGARDGMERVEFDVAVGRETRVELQLDAPRHLIPLGGHIDVVKHPADAVVVSERDGSWHPVVQGDYRLPSGEIAMLQPDAEIPLHHSVLAERGGRLWISRQADSRDGRSSTLVPYEREPGEVVLRLEDDAGYPLFPTEMVLLVDVARMADPGTPGTGVRRVGERISRFGARIVHVGRISLIDLRRSLRAAQSAVPAPPVGGITIASSYELIVVRAKGIDGRDARILPRVVPLESTQAVRLERAPRLAVSVRDAEGPVGGVALDVAYDFGAEITWRYRSAPSESLGTDRFGLAVLPPPLPGARMLLRVTVPPGYRAPEALIEVPSDAKSPLLIQLEKE
ncbi:MAG: hypothetical protein AB7T63_13475 [Planctomycetota bacterium]